MSYFASQQSYNNFLSEITQKASQDDNQNEQYQDAEAQAKESSTLMGTEMIMQSVPGLVSTVGRLVSRGKQVYDAVVKVKDKGMSVFEASRNAEKKLRDKMKTVREKAEAKGQDVVDDLKERGSSIVDGLKAKGSALVDTVQGNVDRFSRLSSSRLEEITQDVKDHADTAVEALKAKGQELTPEMKAHYDKVSSLAEDSSPEGVAKLQSAYKDFNKSFNVKESPLIKNADAIAQKRADIVGTFKDKADLNLSKLKARNELTPEFQAKYDKFVSLAEKNDLSTEGMAKFETAYTDFKGSILDKLQRNVSSTGKTAISKLSPNERIARLNTSMETEKSKIANFTKNKDDSIANATAIKESKMTDLTGRKAELQRKIDRAESQQEEFRSRGQGEARLVAPDEVRAYRTGGSVRMPQGQANGDMTSTISGYKGQMDRLDSRIKDVNDEHLSVVSQAEDLHAQNIASPLAKIEELNKTLRTTGKTPEETGLKRFGGQAPRQQGRREGQAGEAVADDRPLVSKSKYTMDDVLGLGGQAPKQQASRAGQASEAGEAVADDTSLLSKLPSVGDVIGHVMPFVDIGMAGQSIKHLANGQDNGNESATLNDINMARHGASGVEDVTSTIMGKIQGQGTAVKSEIDSTIDSTVNAGKDALQGVKTGIESGVDTAVSGTKDAIQAVKTGVSEGADAVGEAVGSVTGPVGELMDAGLLLYSFISGLQDVTKTPYIAPPPPQEINITHQAGIT